MFARIDEDPPSNLIIDPVTKADAFVDKNNVNPAISLALPIRPTEERGKEKNIHDHEDTKNNVSTVCQKVLKKNKKKIIIVYSSLYMYHIY